LFLEVGGGAFVLAYLAGEAADRRGDACVFLLSIAFLVAGGSSLSTPLGRRVSCSTSTCPASSWRSP
jgi:hypothetical protein